MKSNKFSRITHVFKSIFNVRAWLDYDRVRAFSLYLFNGIKKLFVPQPMIKSDSDEGNKLFAEKAANLHLSQEDLNDRAKGLYRLAILMCSIATCIFIYGIYNLFYARYSAVIVSFTVMLVALVLAFRYHFWYFQIKQRKLGCSIKEWYRQSFLGDK